MLRVERVATNIVLREKVGEILKVQILWELTLRCCLHHHVSQDVVP
jgi:hypothetical protein